MPHDYQSECCRFVARSGEPWLLPSGLCHAIAASCPRRPIAVNQSSVGRHPNVATPDTPFAIAHVAMNVAAVGRISRMDADEVALSGK